MSAPKVLLTIHGIGTLFIWLWFVGSCSKEGMWNNTITFLDAMLASFITIPLWAGGTILVIGMIKPGPDDFYLAFAVAMGIGWFLYLVSFAVIHAITDRVSKTKVAFHPLADKIGSIFFAWSLSGPLGLFSYPILILVQLEVLKG